MQTDISHKLNPEGIISYKLNVGCGNDRIPDYVNIDIDRKSKADIIHDIREGMPWKDGQIKEILFFHTIEHIEEKFHRFILEEFHRVLEYNGILLISYPEFTICAQNYIDNVRGMRDFWKNTIYGLQRSASDFHVSLMNSELLVELLQNIGFQHIMYSKESEQEPWNTVMLAHKNKSTKSYEELLNSEVLGVVD
jgi:predicted SAM-dependent methyltransferase